MIAHLYARERILLFIEYAKRLLYLKSEKVYPVNKFLVDVNINYKILKFGAIDSKNYYYFSRSILEIDMSATGF